MWRWFALAKLRNFLLGQPKVVSKDVYNFVRAEKSAARKHMWWAFVQELKHFHMLLEVFLQWSGCLPKPSYVVGTDVRSSRA